MSDGFKTATLKCPSCSADLTITPDMDVFACSYCGTQQVVKRSSSTISLKLIGAIAKVQVGTDRTAAELAIRRLRDDYAVADADGKRIDNLIEECDSMSIRYIVLIGLLIIASAILGATSSWVAMCITAIVAILFGFIFLGGKGNRAALVQKRQSIQALKADLKRQLKRHHEIVSGDSE